MYFSKGYLVAFLIAALALWGVAQTPSSTQIGVGLTGSGSSVGPVAAGDVTFTPAGTIAATDVQAALEELDTDIQNISLTGLSCTPVRTDGTNIDIASCEFMFPGMLTPADITNINVEVTNANTGIVFGWADADGEFKVGTTGGVTVACTACTDEGTIADFPHSAKEIFKWSVTTGTLAADDGSQDFRRTINGPLYLIDGSTTTVNRTGTQWSLEVNTATLPAKSSHSRFFPAASSSSSGATSLWLIPGTGGATAPTPTGTAPHRYAYTAYPDDADTSASIMTRIPTDWDGGDIRFTIGWMLTNLDALGAVVAWTVETSCPGTADLVNPTYNTAQSMPSTTTTASQRVTHTVSLSALTLTSCSAGSPLWIRLNRIANDADATDTVQTGAGLLWGEMRWLEDLP